ncbi:MAG TPA: hypothetical protein VGD56_19160 [Gemmatirosa sp.]
MTPAAHWAVHADALVARDRATLVNRDDVWGQYRPLHKRETAPDGTQQKHWTLPARDRRGVERLTPETIARHYRGRDVGHVIGLHAIGADGCARWLAFDFDNHEDRADVTDGNRAAAADLCRWLAFFGLAGLIEDSDGRGGLHVWALFDRPAPAPLVYAFAQAVLLEAKTAAETYPKQAHVPHGKYGSWLRLPGRHHTRDHVSRFLIDGAWCAPEDAPRAWLEAPRSDPAAMLHVAGTLPSAERAPDPATVVRVVPWQPPTTPTDVTRRVEGYMRRLPTGLGAGEGRNHAGFRFACWLVRDMALDDADARAWLTRWNAQQRTPMSSAKVAALVSDAHAYGSRGVGTAIDDARHMLRTEIGAARTRPVGWAAGVLGAVPPSDAAAVLRKVACL